LEDGVLEIIPIGKSSEYENLASKVKADFEKYVKSIIEGKTPLEDFPGGKIPSRPIRGGGDVDYVPGWWFIKAANAIFQYNWSFYVDREFVGENQIWVKGHTEVVIPGNTVIEEFPDGRKITTIHPEFKIVKSQYGGSDIKRSKEGNKVIDIGDDLKSAGTDCMKKCLTQSGFCSDIYGPREMKEVGKANSEQLDTLYKVGEKANMTREEVIEFAIKEFDGRPENLRDKEVVILLGKLRKKVRVVPV